MLREKPEGAGAPAQTCGHTSYNTHLMSGADLEG